jgi:hypothetical protein
MPMPPVCYKPNKKIKISENKKNGDVVMEVGNELSAYKGLMGEGTYL